jgi:phenylalanyl-tRNA synthetase beta chain
MRHSLLASVLEIVERNARLRDHIAVFEIGPVYWVSEGESLPEERLLLAIAMTGAREPGSWKGADLSPMDFFDLKGVLEDLIVGLNIDGIQFEPREHPSFHPGKCAHIIAAGSRIGVIGELHPLVKERYEFLEPPVLAAEIDLEKVLKLIPDASDAVPVPSFPPVLEDLAVVVDEEISAQAVEELLRAAGGDLLTEVGLFDLYQGEQIQSGKKSLAYALVYQAPDRTLTDEEVAKIRARIIKKLESEMGAKLRD